MPDEVSINGNEWTTRRREPSDAKRSPFISYHLFHYFYSNCGFKSPDAKAEHHIAALTSDGLFANEFSSNERLFKVNELTLFAALVWLVRRRSSRSLSRWHAADSRRWFASRSLTVIDSRTETSWLTRASQMHAVFVFSVSCQINKIFECLVNLSRSFMARSHARDPAGRDPHLGGSWSWMGVANGLAWSSPSHNTSIILRIHGLAFLCTEAFAECGSWTQFWFEMIGQLSPNRRQLLMTYVMRPERAITWPVQEQQTHPPLISLASCRDANAGR